MRALVAAALVSLLSLVSFSARAHGDLAVPTEKSSNASQDDDGPSPELDVVPNAPPPAGYHLARRPRKAAIIGGGLLFVPTYAFAVSRAFGSDCDGCDSGRQHRLFAPVVGPFWFALGCDGRCGSPALWAADGVLQTLGVALAAYGLVPRPVWVLDSTAEVRLAPLIGAGNTGISVIGTF